MYTETRLKWFGRLKATALILGSILIFSGCCPNPVVVQADPSLTAPIEKPELEGETWRDLAEAYLRRGEAIDNANARLKELRDGQN